MFDAIDSQVTREGDLRCVRGKAMKTAIVVGVGPDRGLGAQLCKRFAAEGLKVIVAGRTKSA